MNDKTNNQNKINSIHAGREDTHFPPHSVCQQEQGIEVSFDRETVNSHLNNSRNAGNTRAAEAEDPTQSATSVSSENADSTWSLDAITIATRSSLGRAGETLASRGDCSLNKSKPSAVTARSTARFLAQKRRTLRFLLNDFEEEDEGGEGETHDEYQVPNPPEIQRMQMSNSQQAEWATPVVATPVFDDDFRDEKRSPFRDKRVWALLLLAIGAVVGMAMFLVLKSTDSKGKEASLVTDTPAGDPDVVEDGNGGTKYYLLNITPFSMEISSFAPESIERELLIPVTEEHISLFASNVPGFLGMNLTVNLYTVENQARLVQTSIVARFNGSIKLEEESTLLTKGDIQTIFNEAFSLGDNVDSFLQLAIDEGMEILSLSVMDEMGNEIGSTTVVASSPVPFSDAPSVLSDAAHSSLEQHTSSKSPSEMPTEKKTDNPSVKPYGSPTSAPSVSFALAGVYEPSSRPSKSNAPNALPSISISSNPSYEPGISPSHMPSKAGSPTETIIEGASGSPTETVGEKPSGSPTETVSEKPSGAFTTSLPTSAPLRSPTKSPSRAPTLSPSKQPTEEPTRRPTDAPTSSSPTTAPTNSPTSSSPTASPTKEPTRRPTDSPTSSSPTKAPTDSPTSSSPTASPTNAPTDIPTTIPTYTPTASPTTKAPTLFPTASPTAPTNAVATPPPTDAPTRKPLGACESGVCDTCSIACPDWGTYARASNIAGYQNDVYCCVGEQACAQNSIVQAPSTNPDAMVCCIGKQACKQATVSIPRGGLCCNEEQSCAQADFVDRTGILPTDGTRTPVQCIGKQACKQARFGENGSGNNVDALVDICCIGDQACKKN